MSLPPLDTPSPERSRLREEEFAALRATIRERGTRRVTLVVATVIGWAALTLAAQAFWPLPLSTLFPLLVLAAGFEAAFALHVGVERIGRYLQVEYERGPDGPAWEHTAMQFGTVPTPAAGKVDPLFSSIFMLATALNFTPAVLLAVGTPGGAAELAVYGLAHAALLVRVLLARSYAARQRAMDLAALESRRRA